MERIDEILIELDHYKRRTDVVNGHIKALSDELKFITSRIALLLTELSKLRSE